MRTRYKQKKDQHGRREQLSDSVAMNAMEQLVHKELEEHLLLNQSRLRTFAHYELEIRTYIEAKHGGKVKITTDFTKDDGGHRPMDIGALGIYDLSALAKGGKGGKGGKGFTANYSKKCDNCGKNGHVSKDCWQKKDGKGGKGGKGSKSDRKSTRLNSSH